MPAEVGDKAELMVPMTGHHGGKQYPVKGLLRGHDGEWFRVKRGRHHHRVVKIGPEGRSETTSYRVRSEDFVELALPATMPRTSTPEVSIVGQRGSIVIASRLRERLGITEGMVVLQEEREGGVWIRPAQVTPRSTEPVPEQRTRPTLAELLAGITPENLHEEIDFGPPVGAELL